MVKTDPVSVRMDPAVKEALERLAKQEGRSLSNYIAHILQQHVESLTKAKKSRA
jgi:predicted DNA-binding protein